MKPTKGFKLIAVSVTSIALMAACADNTEAEDPAGVTPVEPESTEVSETTETGTTIQEEQEPAEDTTQENVQEELGEPEAEAPQQTDQSDSPGIENLEFSVTLQDAIDIFNNEFNSPNIDEIEFEREDGRYVYDFEGWDGEFEYEMEIDAETGEILSQETEADTDTDDILDLEEIISPQEAMATALEATGSGYVEEWDLELENGRTVYDVDIEGGEDQDVDAHTGAIR